MAHSSRRLRHNGGVVVSATPDEAAPHEAKYAHGTKGHFELVEPFRQGRPLTFAIEPLDA